MPKIIKSVKSTVSPKVEAVKAPKVKAPKVEAVKVEAVKVASPNEVVKVEATPTAKVETPKVEATPAPESNGRTGGSTNQEAGHKKTVAQVTRGQFKAKAPKIQVIIAGQTLTLDPREFSTGSLGWYSSDKVTVVIDGVPTKVQVGLNLTVIGSKDLPH